TSELGLRSAPDCPVRALRWCPRMPSEIARSSRSRVQCSIVSWSPPRPEARPGESQAVGPTLRGHTHFLLIEDDEAEANPDAYATATNGGRYFLSSTRMS